MKVGDLSGDLKEYWPSIRAAYLRGLKGYFGLCQTPSLLQQLDQCPYDRLRSMIWTQWKYGQHRYRQLRQRGR
ncbi:MAG: group II intron maturase-specific domain-containing protein [Candidatus Acidiferrum sp.]